MPKYAQIDTGGILIGVSDLSGEVTAENLIPIEDEDFHTLQVRFKRTKYENGIWVEGYIPPPPPTLDELKAQKIAELKQQCESAIIGGYQSTVVLASTSTAHVYPTNRDDQTNLNASATAAQLKPIGTIIEFKTVDAGYVDHTQDEIKAVALEVYEFVLGNLKKVDELGRKVMAAESPEELDLIVW